MESLLLMVAMIAVFYFLIIRPENKRKKQAETMRNSLKKGERIWLENLDGYTDLRGLTITALGENGEIIWTASIPDEEENKGFTHLVNDDWEITNIE